MGQLRLPSFCLESKLLILNSCNRHLLPLSGLILIMFCPYTLLVVVFYSQIYISRYSVYLTAKILNDNYLICIQNQFVNKKMFLMKRF